MCRLISSAEAYIKLKHIGYGFVKNNGGRERGRYLVVREIILYHI